MNLKELRQKLEEQRDKAYGELFANDNIYHKDLIYNLVMVIRNTNKVLRMLDEE